MTTISKSAEILENQVQTGNYNVTYSDIEKVFYKIKEKEILNEPIILDGQARLKTDILTSQKSNKRKTNKKRLRLRNEELEL